MRWLCGESIRSYSVSVRRYTGTAVRKLWANYPGGVLQLFTVLTYPAPDEIRRLLSIFFRIPTYSVLCLYCVCVIAHANGGSRYSLNADER